MKILIIAIPRSGSTSLMSNIAKILSLKPVPEPFNPTFKKKVNYTIGEDDVVVKIITGQDDRYSDIIDWDYWKSFILDFIPQFDKTILLTRMDTKAQLESFSYASHFKKGWFESYTYESPPDEVISDCKEYLDSSIEAIKEVIIKLKNKGIHLEMKYYEDFFDVSSEKRLRKSSKINNTLI